MLIRKIIITLAALTVINSHADQIHVSSSGADIAGCHTNHKCDIHGIHDIEIINDTNEDHKYGYHYMTYIWNRDVRSVTKYIHAYVIIKAHSTWNNHYDSFSKHAFSYSGKYIYAIETDAGYDGVHQPISHKEYQIKVKD